MALVHLESRNDPRLAVYTQLTNRQLRNELEPQKGICIVDSEKAARVALKQELIPVSMLTEEKRLATYSDIVEAMCAQGADVFVLPNTEIEKLVGYRVTRGCMCAFARPQPQALDTVLSSASHVAVLEDICDVANMGAIFRSAAAMGVDAVLLSPGCADPYTRRSIRVSMGTIFQIPFARLDAWPSEGLNMLHKLGFHSYACALSDEACALGHFVPDQKTALIFGTEGNGLQKQTLSLAQTIVTIPMDHQVDSLNVAAASAVFFWEICKRPHMA